jgi:superfamily II DNA or RNA helicase
VRLQEFLAEFADAITDAVVRAYPPVYDAETRRSCAFDLSRLLRRPLGAQADAIRATALSLQRQRGTIVVGEMGVGKAAPLTAKVLTPTGWTMMGDLRAGDRVVGSNGKPTRVVGVYPQGERPIYRVTFTDAAVVDCDEEHLWYVTTPLRKWRGLPGRLLTLRQIMDQGLAHANGNLQHFIPLVGPVEFDDRGGRPLDPYLLGALLGDGGLTQSTITLTSADEELVRFAREALPDGAVLLPASYCVYRFAGWPALLAGLRELGLFGHRAESKYVPDVYMYAPTSVRLAVLQGLLDTDGGVAGRLGTCVEFTSVSQRLARDVVELVQSLGGVARLTVKPAPAFVHKGGRRTGQPAYRVVLTLPRTVPPFRLHRKLDRYHPGTKYGPSRAIKRVDYVGRQPAQCITVEAEDQLYVTDDYVVTHNTYIAAAAAYLAGCRRVFLICPPHLVRKWRREIERTVPGARVAHVRTIRDLERARDGGGAIQFVVCSREQAKLGYRWRPAVVSRILRGSDGAAVRDDTGALARLYCCPSCFAPISDDDGVPLEWADLEQKKRRCDGCGGALWQADRTGPRRVPLADYVLRRMRGHFDLLIADEIHELKARGSAQGLAGAALAEACPKTLVLTGTLLGGYASNLFQLLYRFGAIRTEFAHGDEARWVARYGYLARITKRDPDARCDDGRQSKRRTYPTRVVEKPGVTPPILFYLIGNTVFLRLRDVARHLPAYDERVLLVPLDEGADPDAPSQARAYRQLATELRSAVQQALRAGSKRLLGTYLQALLTYPDACTREETVLYPRTNAVLAHAPALSDERLYPKEQALVDLVRRERERHRRVLAFATHTNLRDITPRLREVLEHAGCRVAVLKADTVPAERREEWVATRVREGLDVLITNPRLVQTGLDLVDFPSIVWAEVDYSVYVLRQASRRSWRIGQRQPVEVTFLTYAGTLQAEALGLVAAKTRASLMVEGELPEEGLAALEGDGGDVYLALARRLVVVGEGSDSRARSLEALFADACRSDAAAEELLLEGGWEDEGELPPEPPPVLVQSMSVAAGAYNGLPLFTTSVTPPLPVSVPPNGRIVTLAEMAQFVRRRKPRSRRVSEEQLTLFDR